MKTAYLDCFSGISGNMTVGAFLDAGMPLEYLQKELAKLPIRDHYQLIYKRVNKQGISAAYFDVDLHHHHHHEENHGQHHHHRGLREIIALINDSSLPDKVKDLAGKIFTRLGNAEAAVHNCSLEEIHFHEVGAVDAIIDIVGAALGIYYLGIEKVYASHLHVGSGTVRCAHGIMPIPAPATAELLKGAPIYATEIKGELVTPTGAAIISTLADGFGPLPPLKVDTIAYGAGSWDLSIPNVVRLYLGTAQDSFFDYDTSTIIEATIDDMNPEFYAHLIDRLFLAGAVDAYMTPIYMKKNRPGVLLSVTSNLTDHQPVLDVIFAESTTIGVRMHRVQRQKLHKSFVTVEVSGETVRVKVARAGDTILNIAPEFEDCRLLAQQTKRPLKEIYQEAMSAASAVLKLIKRNDE